MKRGWLVYDKHGAQKNEWFIRCLQEEFLSVGVELTLRIFQENECFFNEELPDFAIVRLINPRVNERLENGGVRVFNNAKTAAVACDKWETYQSCKAWGIPVLRTVKQGEKMQYPCVMKSRNGHGGEEVFWVETEEETQKILEKQGGGKEYILQAPNEILGKDMRVYAIGGKIVASVLRSSACDFRSNFSLGGKVEKAQADGWQEQVVNTLYQKLKFDYIGVDFLPTATGWVLNEIEDSAGARMLYSCTDIDIVKLYAAHILCEIL